MDGWMYIYVCAYVYLLLFDVVLLHINSTLVGHSTYSWFRKSLTLACNIISMTGTKQDTFLELAQSPNKHKHAHAIIMDKNFNELK